jgi:hypothetical protein
MTISLQTQTKTPSKLKFVDLKFALWKKVNVSDISGYLSKK